MIEIFPSPQIRLPSCRRWFFEHCQQLVPHELEEVVVWADANYRVANKDRDMFNSADSPWMLEPLRMADDPIISQVDYVKPVQVGGGTSLGEIILMRRILDGHGLLGYYWPTNDKAKDRWEKVTEKRLRACRPVRVIMPSEYENMLIKFPNVVFAMQGVFSSGNLDSDTVDYVIAEEVHQMESGMVAKMKGRLTKVDFPKFILISNAGLKGDQLHQEFSEGTQQHFMVRCPGCSNPHHKANTVYHIMRTRWDDAEPQLGGLRYDSEGCKRDDGTFDYNKLVPTIRFQMPCGYVMRDDVSERRAAAQGGQYSDPFNTGALQAHRSYTLQAVACHTMRWLDLIQEKHIALRAMKAGDDTNWRQYCQERESIFYDPEEHRPYQGQTIYNVRLKKNRAGLPGRAYRSATADWQAGYKAQGQLQHYWLLIEDVMPNCDSQIIFEGRVDSDAELLAELDAHEVPRPATWIDCSKNTKAILQLCYLNGMNAVNLQLSRLGSFLHEDRVRRFYSPGKPIWGELNTPPVFPPARKRDMKTGQIIESPDPREPLVVALNKAGMLANHFFIRNMRANMLAADPQARPDSYITVDIPSDVSEEFKRQNEAWEFIPNHRPKNPDDGVQGFRQRSRNDHLLMCRAYQDFVKEWSGYLGERLADLGLPQINEQPATANE